MATLSNAARFFLLLSAASAFAHTSKPQDPKVKLFCEYNLARPLGVIDEDTAREKFLERAFRFDFFYDSTQLAQDTLGIPATLSLDVARSTSLIVERTGPDALDPIRARLFQVQSGFTSDLKNFDFPDEQLSLWHYLVLPIEVRDISHPSIKNFYPPQKAKFHNRKLYLGFHTDFDHEGVRRYVAFDGEDELELGLDVPCEKAKIYLQSGDVARSARVRTPVTDLCRIPVMIFTAP